ncbi:MAG: RDD family protein [Terriglobales bacterium]
MIYCSVCGHQIEVNSKFCAWCGATADKAADETVPFFGAPSVAYAGFWIRFLATVLDGIIINLVLLPVALILGIFVGIAGKTADMPDPGIELVGGLSGFGLGLLANWIYEATFTSSSWQGTPAKRLLNVYVTDLEGKRISMARATGRHFAKYVSGLTLLIGYIMAGFTERKQALHDMLAGTLVRIGRP